jgi:hypothetical protein
LDLFGLLVEDDAMAARYSSEEVSELLDGKVVENVV